MKAIRVIIHVITEKQESLHICKVDVSPVTMNKTNIGKLKVNDQVNLERALKLSDRLGGHLVSGHVDCTGKISKKIKKSDELIIEIQIAQPNLPYIIPRGSVAINGVSLTVVECYKEKFSVSLIPFSANNTNLGNIKLYDSVNVEFDLLAKYLEKISTSPNTYRAAGPTSEKKERDISIEFLQRYGFA